MQPPLHRAGQVGAASAGAPMRFTAYFGGTRGPSTDFLSRF